MQFHWMQCVLLLRVKCTCRRGVGVCKQVALWTVTWEGYMHYNIAAAEPVASFFFGFLAYTIS